MRIYLDTNVYSLLKTKEFESLHATIINDKKNNIYFFSEAHLHDLSRDKTDEKFEDMKLIEKVCDFNCYYFHKKIEYRLVTPRQYYDACDWATVGSQEQTDFMGPIAGFLKLMPIPISDFLKRDQIPDDCPKDFIEFLSKTTNLYEFMVGFMEWTESLTEEQLKFKEFIKYLHTHSLTGSIYETLGIKGFDGNKITDKEAFKDSYLKYATSVSTQKDIFSVFTLMYNGLELLGLVKGKPRKQKLSNLINDAQHAYFGSFCDVVVSRDEDFLAKCSFLYSALGLDNFVLDVETFHTLAQDKDSFPASFDSLVEAILDLKNGEIKTVIEDGKKFYIRDLDRFHYGYFDTLTFVPEDQFNKFIFSKERKSFSLSAVHGELIQLTNILVCELGPDLDNKGNLESEEVTEKGWAGRHWIKNGMALELLFEQKLFIRLIVATNDSP